MSTSRALGRGHSGRTNLRLRHGRRPRTRAVAGAISMSRTENSKSCRSTLSADGARQWLRTTCYGKHHCWYIILGWKNLRLQQVSDATGSNRNDPAQYRTRFAAPGGEQLPRVIIASGARICIRAMRVPICIGLEVYKAWRKATGRPRIRRDNSTLYSIAHTRRRYRDYFNVYWHATPRSLRDLPVCGS